LRRSLTVQRRLEMVYWRWDFQTLIQDRLLSLQSDVLGPTNETRQVSLGLDVLTDPEILGTLFEERIDEFLFRWLLHRRGRGRDLLFGFYYFPSRHFKINSKKSFLKKLKTKNSGPIFPYQVGNNASSPDMWDFFDDWVLSPIGGGQISFQATGNDFKVGIFDTNTPDATNNFDYVVAFAGWGNAMTNVYSAENWGTAVDSVLCTVADVTAYNDYVFDFNSATSTILVTMNENVVVNFTDTTWQAPNAMYYSIMQQGSNVYIKRSKACGDNI